MSLLITHCLHPAIRLAGHPSLIAPDHIYLSPHLDDAVLSCGGMIAEKSLRGERVVIVTICAGSPPDPLPDSPIVRDLHDRWVAAGDAPAMRRAEDVRAAGLLGASVDALHRDFLDCIYRLHPATGAPLYPNEASLFGEVQPDDPLLAALAAIEPLPHGAMLYVPLAIGRHVDHQVVRRAAERWRIAPERLAYYEDYPYAGRAGAIEAATGEPGWLSRVVPLGDEALGAKIKAVAAYGSQISSFWPDLAAMETAVRDFAAQRGGERLWVRTARTAPR